MKHLAIITIMCATSLSATLVAQTQEQLVAIHYSENMSRKDSTFAYDPNGNTVLRMTDIWREENTYDSKGRRTERRTFAEYHDEMKPEIEQAWAFDERGNISLDRRIDYEITSGRVTNSSMQQMTYDEKDRLCSQKNYRLLPDGWTLIESLVWSYDDENNRWTQEQPNSRPATRYEHWCDAAGQDTLIYIYQRETAGAEWQLHGRTLYTFSEYGMTCELKQYQAYNRWVNEFRTVIEYHGSSDSYKRTSDYYWISDDYYPERGEWRSDENEYNYHRQGNTLHIWGCRYGRDFDDEYTFDDEGREINHINHYSSSHSSETITHEYDDQGNLVEYTEKVSGLGLTNIRRYCYTYDDNGAILTAQYLVCDDIYDTDFKLLSSTVYDYDTSVPASDIYGCPSSHYKLLSVTETDQHGNKKVTSYTYEPVDPEVIRQIQDPDTNGSLPCYDLTGRHAYTAHPSHIYKKGNYWFCF